MQSTEAMQRRKEFLIGSLIGLCIMLLALLAVVVSPRPQAALAQDSPRVVISVGDHTMIQGQRTYVHASFHNMPKDPNDAGEFGNISFRYYVERNSDDSWVNADSCAEDLVGGDLYITTWWRTPWNHGGSDNFALTTTCPVGSYRFRVSVTNRDDNTELVSGTHDFTVSLGPSVTIDMPSGPHYRGTSINPTISFNNLVQGADYTYQAYLMARNPANFAEICEGTGLERNNTFTITGASGNPIQKTVTVTNSCPTNEYTLRVSLKDSDDRKRGENSADFEITTDPNATPSVSVSMSESSPVAPGTEFYITFNFYDIQPGTRTQSRDTMFDTSTNQPVGRMDCGGSGVGWGQDVGGSFTSNPYVNLITIPSDCPAGNYRIVSEKEDPSGNDIISGSIDFIIGDPDLTPTAPSVPGYTAKQNTPFTQQLPEGSGGDGTLTYTATPLPAGLSFIATTRTITGTPSGTGSTTVRYTVTDSDGDSDSVDFDITVNADLTPTAPSIPGYTAKQNTLFTQQLPEGSGGDGALSYTATGLPTGLTFITTTRTITGTPSGTGVSPVRYTVTDSDGDFNYVDFNITVDADLKPTLPTISGYTIKVGVQFTQQLPAGSGGDAPLSYAAMNLPAGLSFITTTRTITGTPAGTGSSTVQYKVTDSDGDSHSVDFNITVSPDLTPTAPSISGYTAKQNAPFTQQLPEGSGGDAPLSYDATPLPAGLSFITSTRTIAGTPTGTGPTSVRYTVTDSDGDSAHVDFDITVDPDLAPTAPSITGYNAKQNSPFSQQLPEGTGGDAPLSYDATPLPAGLSFITTTRTIAGTPTETGATSVQYTVTDSDGDSNTVDFNITVDPDLRPTAPSVRDYTAKQNSLFTEQLPVGGDGDGPLSYAATGLPDGLSFITTTRTITGTPTGTGQSTVHYTVTDSDGDSASVDFKITVAADLMPTLGTISDTHAKLTKLFTLQLPAGSDGDGVLDYDATNLPPGLSFITSTRTITGTPTNAGKYLVTYTATDEDGDVATQTFYIEAFAMPSLQAVQDSMAPKDEVFTLELTAVSGGRGPFEYEATPLPTGLEFVTSTLKITGTPTEIQEVDVAYSVEDADGDTASRQFKISVSEGDTNPAFPYEIQDYDLRVGSPFAVTLPSATGGNAPYTYTISGHPDTLTFNTETRRLSGTPSASQTGQHQVTYTATDRDGDPVSQTFNLNIAADNQPSEPSIGDMHFKVGYLLWTKLPEATGGDPPYTYTITTLPSGMIFDRNTRVLSGRPDAVGATEVTYTVFDEDSDSAAEVLTIHVYALPELADISDTSGMKGELFTLELAEATGGRPPLIYSVTGLPEGLDFITATRFITGTPTQVEVGNVTYKVVDQDDDQDTVTFKITVTDLSENLGDINNNNNNNNNNNGNNNGGTQNPPALTLTDTSGFTLRVGEQFTQQLPGANGGTPPYQYAVTALPAGLTFNRGSHTLSGKPTAPGTTNITYSVTDANGNRASDDFTITVNAAPLSLGDTTGFSATVGVRFTQQLPAATGGTSPYAYGVTTLPEGLTFEHATRTITGTPSVAETRVVTYSVSDGNRNSAHDAFTITVNEALTTQPEGTEGNNGNTQGSLQLTLVGAKEFNATVGVLYTQQLPAATGGSSPYAYGVNVLPAGLRFEHATRTITGTPTTAETAVVTYSVTDGTRTSASDTFTITVTASPNGQPGGIGGANNQNPLQLSLGQTKEFTATVGTLFTQQLPAASGGSSPYAYGVTTLPAGLNFLLATRTITGTPTTAETKVVTYSVTDGAQARASDTFTITVGEAQGGPPGQPGGGGNQGGRGPGGTPGGSNQGGNNQGGNNQGGNNQGGGNQGGGGGGGNQGGKKNSGSSGNQQKYVPPSSYSPPSQQHWSPSHTPVAVTLPQWLNVRRGPGIDYEIITSVPEGTRGNIYGRDAADNWFQVQINEVSDLSWVCQDLTRVEGSLDNVRLLAQWEIDLIPKSSDGPLATTTPAILNVRAGPGLDYEILTTVPKGTEAAIIGIGPNAQWYMVTLEALNRPAWIYAGLTTLTGFLGGVKQYTLAEVNGYTYTEADGTDTCGANPVAITIPAIMNVRNGPGLSYDIVTTVVKGTRADIIGIGPLDEWFLVRLDKLDEPAWLYRGLTTVVGSLAGVRRIDSWQDGQPNVVTDAERPNAVTYPSLVNIRVGPGLTYPVLKTVRQGTRASIIGLSPDANWYLVEIDGMSQLGWIREDLTVLVGNLNNVKRITAAELAMLPVAIVDTPKLNVRTGPGLGYRLVTTIPEGTWVQIIGVNARADWYQVKMRGVTGQTWVYRDLTNLAGLLAGVTQISSSTVAAEYDPALHATTILEAASTVESSSPQQLAVNAITVDLSLPANGNINLKVSWTDAEFCSEVHNLYYRSGAGSTTYFSLENAVIATASNSKSLSFLTLPDRSLISAWCGTHSNGRQIAEVHINANEEGIYSSLPSQPESGTVAAVP